VTSNKLLSKPLTPQQRSFLNYLIGEAKGNMLLAKDLAGYSDKTQLVDVISPLREHIIALTKDALLNGGLLAAFGLIDVIDNPSQMGAGNKVKAASEVLDRIGVTKPDDKAEKGPEGAIFILPPKNVTAITVGDVKINIEGNEEMDDDDIISDVNYTDNNPSTPLDDAPQLPLESEKDEKGYLNGIT